MSDLPLIRPDWRVAPRVQALITTRQGGVSVGPYGRVGGSPGGLNVAAHVGDLPSLVEQNRARLPVPSPTWLEQVHGVHVVVAGQYKTPPKADAVISSQPGQTCVVLTADCLPVLLADREGRCVGAAHAGWRGLLNGVLEATVRALRATCPDTDLVAYLGPAIGPQSYEVGAEVVEAFERFDRAAQLAVRPGRVPGKYWLDLYTLARQRLGGQGVMQISGGDADTYADSARFYSFRRDGVCGRMASCVWLAD